MNLMSVLMFAATLVTAPAFAHDGGHGPQLSDAGKQGGIVAPVIEAKDVKKGAHAEPAYKAEMVRTEDGTVHVFLYDTKMNALEMGKFEASARGVVEFKKSKKWVKEGFPLKSEDGGYLGKAPKVKAKPFNIDITFKDAGGREFLTAFDNLD